MAVMSEIPKGFVMVQLDCYEMNGDINKANNSASLKEM